MSSCLILRPWQLGCVYYLLIGIIRKASQYATFFAHLLAGPFGTTSHAQCPQ